MAPPRAATRVTLANIRKSNSISSENSIIGKNMSFAKRKAENSPPKGGNHKKPAFNDIENDKSKLFGLKGLKSIAENQSNVPLTRSKTGKPITTTATRNPLGNIPTNAVSGIKLSQNKTNCPLKAKDVTNVVKAKPVSKPVTRSSSNSTLKPCISSKPAIVVTKEQKPKEVTKVVKKIKSKTELDSTKNVSKLAVKAEPEIHENQENIKPVERERPVTRLSSRLSLRKSLSEEKSSESSSLYISALEEISITSSKEKVLAKNEKPISEFDKELLHDPHQVSLYAMEIFEYLKSREPNFACEDYMSRQKSINENMRAVLVDWMVEVQESFELNHETLYLAVRIVDKYLSKVVIPKEKLQLVGAAAMFLSCKYDERLSPLIDDFVYICDNAYTHDDLLAMEQNVLYHIKFELSFPISYSFLRRYARCARIQMPLLTLARYILELALMNYKTVTLSDSKQAAAALYLAFKMVKHDEWNDKLEYYTGYKKSDFKDIVLLFNKMLHQDPCDQLKTIKTKYSHELFFRVANTPLLEDDKLDLE